MNALEESLLFTKKGWREFISSLPNGLSEESRCQTSIHFYDWLGTKNENIGFKLGFAPSDCFEDNYSMILMHWDDASFNISFCGNNDEFNMEFVINLPNFRKVVEIPYFYRYGVIVEGCFNVSDSIRYLPNTQKEMSDFISFLDKMVIDIKNGKLFRMMAIGEILENSIWDAHHFINCIERKNLSRNNIDSFMKEAEKFTIEKLGQDKIIKREKWLLNKVLDNKMCGLIRIKE